MDGLNAWIDTIDQWLGVISGYVWGWPMLILLVGTGIYLTILLRGMQFWAMPHAFRLIFHRDEAEGDITHFSALMTALAATVGNGNIVGVAAAIALGGPGAVFWMWMTGLLGMATKYAEAVLAVRYREQGPHGMCGGPMYYLAKGARLPWLGALFAVFASISAFGIGNMFQVTSVSGNLHSAFGIEPWITGVVLMVLTGLVILGGIKSIGRVSSVLVPFMILGYVVAALVCLILNAERIPAALAMIFHHAFTPSAAMGGTLGALLARTISMGVARGVFSNESGLGSAAIAAAAAKTKDSATQALVSMTQTFIDTIIVCTMTALVILTAPLPATFGTYLNDWREMPAQVMPGTYEFVQDGAAPAPGSSTPLRTKEVLTSFSMELTLGKAGAVIVALASALFAYSTLLGWSYYGEKALEYLLGPRSVIPYRAVFVAFTWVGAVLPIGLIIDFSDVMNGLMAIPNLIGLVLLAGVVNRETNSYFAKRKAGAVSPETSSQ